MCLEHKSSHPVTGISKNRHINSILLQFIHSSIHPSSLITLSCCSGSRAYPRNPGRKAGIHPGRDATPPLDTICAHTHAHTHLGNLEESRKESRTVTYTDVPTKLCFYFHLESLTSSGLLNIFLILFVLVLSDILSSVFGSQLLFCPPHGHIFTCFLSACLHAYTSFFHTATLQTYQIRGGI